jgi:hypothetical protein
MAGKLKGRIKVIDDIGNDIYIDMEQRLAAILARD